MQEFGRDWWLGFLEPDLAKFVGIPYDQCVFLSEVLTIVIQDRLANISVRPVLGEHAIH
jgi:hypothetical protein